MLQRICWLLLLACAPALALEDCYTADASGGEVKFRVMQAGAPFSGTFRRFSGEICFTQGRMTRIDATLDPASVDSGLPELDVVLKDKDFFAVREFPRVRFVSSTAQSQGDTHSARGTLEIKGVRRETDIVLRTQQAGGKLSIAGSLTLDRLQYGIGTGEWSNTQWLGAQVALDVKAVLTPKK
jgi:polyisoprenoid-binding protein YceI